MPGGLHHKKFATTRRVLLRFKHHPSRIRDVGSAFTRETFHSICADQPGQGQAEPRVPSISRRRVEHRAKAQTETTEAQTPSEKKEAQTESVRKVSQEAKGIARRSARNRVTAPSEKPVNTKTEDSKIVFVVRAGRSTSHPADRRSTSVHAPSLPPPPTHTHDGVHTRARFGVIVSFPSHPFSPSRTLSQPSLLCVSQVAPTLQCNSSTVPSVLSETEDVGSLSPTHGHTHGGCSYQCP